jgi:tetratricopeptide (TPR) repeat protein
MAVLILCAANLSACGDSGGQIVGSWKGRGIMGYTQDSGEFSADGTCKIVRGGTPQVCDWAPQVGGSLKIRYGTEHPTTTVRGVIHDDQMWFMQGDHTESSWIRSGSPLDVSVTAYTNGQSLIQAGDFEHGMAALKEAADRGFDGAQNSLAWNYAAAKEPRFRDGKKAVAYAEKAVAQFHYYQYLDTLAVAFARDGQFERAAKIETEALGLLQKDTERPAADRVDAEGRFRGRIALFQARQPFTEP